MKRDYERLKCTTFGRRLLETEDLDPVYTMLVRAELEEPLLFRWLLGYFLFYHSGVASLLAAKRGDEFFQAAASLAMSKCPRGTERRHFRLEPARSAIQVIALNCSERPEEFVEGLLHSNGDLKSILTAVQQFPQFGPWMAFKIADMIERVVGERVHFPEDCLAFYQSPKQGAKQFAEAKGWNWEQRGLIDVVNHLLGKFSKYKAPPRFDRPVGVQEIETILCKWHSHLSGHYPIGKDTHEIRESLVGWGPLADRLSKHLPKGVPIHG